MIPHLSIIRLALILVLLLESLISRSVTGSALHQALLLAGLGVCAASWWLGPTAASLSGLIAATGIGLGGWWLFERGVAPISLSELPTAFHFSVGLHFWVWSKAIGGRRQPASEIESAVCHPLTALLTVLGGVLVVWATVSSEIYGRSILGVRSMAVAVLVLSTLLVAGSADTKMMGSSTSTIERSRSETNQHRTGAMLACLAAVGGAIWLGAWSLGGTEKVAAALFLWVGNRNATTELAEFGATPSDLPSGSGFEDGAMRDLPRRADIQLDSTVRFRIQFDDLREFSTATRRTLYLRSSAMPVFAGDGRLGPMRQGRWIFDSDDQVEDGVTRIGERPDQSSLNHWVLIDRSESRAVPLMTGTHSLGLPGIYAFADGWFQLALEDHQEHVRFQARAVPLTWTAESAPPDLEPVEASEDYLRLPQSPLMDRVDRLAREQVDPTGTLNERLAALQRLFADRCQYSLKYENPGDLEPVENFLFGERKGHCELYSASTVMLLRSLGIPSRVAFGFAGGESDPSRGLIAYRQFDYHSWAEILVREHGWMVFDTTPPGSGALRPPRPNPRGPALASFDPGIYENIGNGAIVGVAKSRWFSRSLTTLIEWVSRWFPTLCAVTGGTLLSLWWIRRKRLGPGPRERAPLIPRNFPSSNSDQIDNLLADYLQACAAKGYAKPPGMTLMEFLRELKSQGVCGDELDDLTHYFYRVRYAGGSPDADRENTHRAVIAHWAHV